MAAVIISGRNVVPAIAKALDRLPVLPERRADVQRFAEAIAGVGYVAGFFDIPRFRTTGSSKGRKQLERTAKAAAELSRLLALLNENPLHALTEAAEEVSTATGRPLPHSVALSLDLVRFSAAAKMASQRVGGGDGGAPSKGQAAIVAAQCAQKFEALTGKRPTVTTDPETGKASGAFVELVASVFAALEVDASATAQAKVILQKTHPRG